MTLQDKQKLLLADLIAERAQFGERWESYYGGKIAEMREAIYGSGSGDQAGRDTGVSDVPGGDAQALREE